jgi:hypothetical protein
MGFKLISCLYAPTDILGEVYWQREKQFGRHNQNLRNFADNPNTPARVLDVLAEMPLSLTRNSSINVDDMHRYIATLIDHSNASAAMRTAFYDMLDSDTADEHAMRYYIAPGIMMATTNPESINRRLTDEVITGRRNGARFLLENPSLPLALSEKIVAAAGCGQAKINETYARAHFNKRPGGDCDLSALYSAAAPRQVRAEILADVDYIGVLPDLLANQPVNADTMHRLYAEDSGRYSRQMASNPDTPADILADLFEHSRQGLIMEALASNPSTPVWMLERIYHNDFVVTSSGGNLERRLVCNPALPDRLRKRIAYPQRELGCRF